VSVGDLEKQFLCFFSANHTGEIGRLAEFFSILERKVEKNRQPLPLDPRIGGS
jgi:hypothetical protein